MTRVLALAVVLYAAALVVGYTVQPTRIRQVGFMAYVAQEESWNTVKSAAHPPSAFNKPVRTHRDSTYAKDTVSGGFTTKLRTSGRGPSDGKSETTSRSSTLYIFALDQPAIDVSGLDHDFLTESVPVMLCESRGDPNAVSPTDDYGLMQLNRRWQEDRANRLGFDWSQMLEPLPNILVAEAIWREQSWRAWSCKP